MQDTMSRSYEQMAELAVACLNSSDPAPPWEAITAEICSCFNGTACVLFDGVSWRRRSATPEAWWPASLGRSVPLKSLSGGALHDHPLALHYAANADSTPVAITDVVADAVWRRTELFDLTKAIFGVTDELCIPLTRSRTTYRTIITGRPDELYRDNEKNLASRLQPLLMAVDSHLRHLQQWTESVPNCPADVVADHNLSPRQVTVLHLLALGLTAAAIARRLVISPHTVAKHQEHIYRKLGTHDRLSTVVLAQRLGIIPSEPRIGQAGVVSELSSARLRC
jgi:DNA-binding CsgD family transcriptional regulator